MKKKKKKKGKKKKKKKKMSLCFTMDEMKYIASTPMKEYNMSRRKFSKYANPPSTNAIFDTDETIYKKMYRYMRNNKNASVSTIMKTMVQLDTRQPVRFKYACYDSQILRAACVFGRINMVVAMLDLIKKDLINTNKRDASIIDMTYINKKNSAYIMSQAFAEAAAHGHVRIVQKMMTYSFMDPSYNNNNAYKTARTFNHTDVMSVLMQDARVYKQ